MTSWLKRTQAGVVSASTSAKPAHSATTPVPTKLRDPNSPDIRLEIESKCIYERRLPGNAYVTAHIKRLQAGFYDSPVIHGDSIDNVRFLAVDFVFHPSETVNRFKSANISIALHDDTDQRYSDPSAGHKRESIVPKQKPKFLRFAPHVLFGGVSPETLDWSFNLTGSLGVSQMPVSASLSPSGGFKSSYKVFQMMRVQGSLRTLKRWHQHEYDIEDGEVYWTMEENPLQKSGLPREFTFVMLITKGDVENVVFDIDIDAKIGSWFGSYPDWYCNLVQFRPFQKDPTDLDKQLGQKFEPAFRDKGFNFANLAGSFNDFVSLPGTTYSSIDQSFAGPQNSSAASAQEVAKPQAHPSTTATHPQAALPQSFDINVYLKSDQGTVFRTATPDRSRQANGQPLSNKRSIDITYKPRQSSLRRSRSRTDLKDESANFQRLPEDQRLSSLAGNRKRFSFPVFTENDLHDLSE